MGLTKMKIKSLEVENIKLFDKKFDRIKRISHVDLVLLNGPNGYGKTTIFDAMELALTGEIKRIKIYNENLGVAKNEKYDKKILITDPSKEAYVSLTLEEGGSELKLLRLYEKPSVSKKSKSSTDNNPHKIFEKFVRKLYVNGEEVLEKDKQETVLESYHLNNITEFFDKCCFLSQDEHLQFLKEAKKDKSVSLEFLFQLPEKQKKEIERLDRVISSLQNSNTKNNLGYIQKLEKGIGELKEKVENLQKIAKENQVSENGDEKENLEYESLFPQKGIKWDKQMPVLSDDEYVAFNSEIDDLIYFAKNQQNCINYVWNKPFRDIIKPFSGNEDIRCEDNALEYAYRYFSLVLSGESIEKKYHKQQQFEQLKMILEKRDIHKINWEVVSSENLLNENAINWVKQEIGLIGKLKQTQGTVDRIITSLNDTRNALLQRSREAMDSGTIEDKECPFCGTPYEERSILENSILAEGEKLLSLSKGAAQDIQNKVNEIYEKYLNNMMIVIQSGLQDRISETLYKKCQEVKGYKGNIDSIKTMLQAVNINLPEVYEENITEISKGYDVFIGNIKQHLRPVVREIEEQLIAKKFELIYNKYYDNAESRFREITDLVLQSKKKYIGRIFCDANREMILEKQNELKKLEKRHDKLKEMYDELCGYRKAIDEGIIDYKKKVIHDIEPLLHVYTAKILQQKFCGKSIFILTDDKMENFQLIHSAKDNHDILYNMSSGQLAAVSLSFLLCMNQVYAQQQSLPVLLIDDPIQTIDDVNMVGLVDILRFEFKNTQIFISTHEQKFEWYLKYKYEKAGKKMKAYNMKDILLRTNTIDL